MVLTMGESTSVQRSRPTRWRAGVLLLGALVLVTVSAGAWLATLGEWAVVAGLLLVSWLLTVGTALLAVAVRPGLRRRLVRTLRTVVGRGGSDLHDGHGGSAVAAVMDGADFIPAGRGAPEGAAPPSGSDILFVTSNGAGLGHLTRVLAISRALPESCSASILTMSLAYRTVAGREIDVRYFPSAQATGMEPRQWNPALREYMTGLLRSLRPRVVVFDGTYVYRGLTQVCRESGVPLVWLQRGCWLPEVDARSQQRHQASEVVDAVVVPGDYAVQERVDVGPGIDATHVGPVTLLSRDDLLTREQACAALGLDPARRHLLFNLGGGNISDPGSQLALVHSAVQSMGEGWETTVVRSPLATDEDTLPDGFNVVRAYPVARYTRAFDLTVAAAGYNAVQEAAALGIPSVFVPNEQTRTDDQGRRADEAARAGWALVARGAGEVTETVTRAVGDPELLRSLRTALNALPAANGAHEAADHIVRRWVHPAAR